MLLKDHRYSRIFRIFMRGLVIVGFVLVVHWLLSWTMDQIDNNGEKSQSFMLTTIIVLLLLALAALMAIPFVPGVEIAITLVILKGPVIAPFVYLATLFGLILAFLVGRLTPYPVLQRFFADFGMARAASLLDRLAPLDTAARLAILQDRLPQFMRPLAKNWRYLFLALVLQIPGNSVISGGGGISLMAGISRLFGVKGTIFTFILAVAPIPLFIYFFGTDFLAKMGAI